MTARQTDGNQRAKLLIHHSFVNCPGPVVLVFVERSGTYTATTSITAFTTAAMRLATIITMCFTTTSLNGKAVNVDEWKIINRALNEVFGEVNNVKALNMLINSNIIHIQLDSLVSNFDLEQIYVNNF